MRAAKKTAQQTPKDPVITSPSKNVSLHQRSIISSTCLPPESPFYSQKKSVQGRSGLTNPKSIFTFLVTWEGTANGSQTTIVVHENTDFSTKSWGKFDSECLIFNLQLFSTGKPCDSLAKLTLQYISQGPSESSCSTQNAGSENVSIIFLCPPSVS